MSDLHLLCLACGTETTVPATQSIRACPSCGETNPPADLDTTLTIRITTHELRILTMWASNFAATCGGEKPIQTILDRLSTQTDVPLSLSQEFADLRAAFGDVKVYREGKLTDE